MIGCTNAVTNERSCVKICVQGSGRPPSSTLLLVSYPGPLLPSHHVGAGARCNDAEVGLGTTVTMPERMRVVMFR